MEVTGAIKRFEPIKTFGSNNENETVNVVIETEEQYPQTLSIEFIKDKVQEILKVPVGTKVKIGVNLLGREWTNKDGVLIVFNTIRGWRFEEVKTS